MNEFFAMVVIVTLIISIMGMIFHGAAIWTILAVVAIVIGVLQEILT